MNATWKTKTENFKIFLMFGGTGGTRGPLWGEGGKGVLSGVEVNCNYVSRKLQLVSLSASSDADALTKFS